MQYDEFIDRVLAESRLTDRERAVEITQATLETLGERLEGKVRRDVAAQLPSELKEYLLSRPGPDRYELQEFYRRVGARADTKYFDAAERAKAVTAVLREALTTGQVQEIVDTLPSEFGDLFNDGPQGPGFPSLDR